MCARALSYSTDRVRVHDPYVPVKHSGRCTQYSCAGAPIGPMTVRCLAAVTIHSTRLIVSQPGAVAMCYESATVYVSVLPPPPSKFQQPQLEMLRNRS
jgi:hypothetical protein